MPLSLSLSLCFEKEVETKKLGDIATFEYGNYDGKAEEKGKHRLVRITDIDEYGNISEKDKKYVDLSKEFKVDKFLSKGDIVVSRQAFPARAGIFEGEKAVLSSNLVKIKFDEKILSPKYFLWFSQTQEWKRQVKQLTKGTAQPVFSANSLKEIKMPIPSLGKQRAIIQEREKVLLIINYQKQSIKLLKGKEERILNSLWENK
ncbi:restriction endonuclease subunit S [endosymbiont GvMRE of Glomus versiforme]|uniref:restriction endonuclease subunit S n=1 Tax=endosymbiont GvMRE of Glomus versiforme TaxID=2039283 RepID=UPI0011C415FA|nr:restriction endonuclease subunit S [endosymbiont GvMRE of Glomus versiforme]